MKIKTDIRVTDSDGLKVQKWEENSLGMFVNEDKKKHL